MSQTKILIEKSEKFTDPCLAVMITDENQTEIVGHVKPHQRTLFFSASGADGTAASFQKYFAAPDQEIENLFDVLTKYCRDNDYTELYINKISNGAAGAAAIRSEEFWKNIGFKNDENPDLMVKKI